MAGELAARFRRAERIPPVIKENQNGPRRSAAASEIVDFILAWDKESDDPDDKYRVVDCEDGHEARWLYQVCANASHSRPVYDGTKYIYDVCKRGLQVFLVRKGVRPYYDWLIKEKRQ